MERYAESKGKGERYAERKEKRGADGLMLL
jgi:hypothetical protein